MKYSIGYQLPDEYDSIHSICCDYRDAISSVYFSLPGKASARNEIQVQYESLMLKELKQINDLGIALVLLYNANCYGDQAVSKEFYQEIVESISSLQSTIKISGVTTTSPFIAKTVKKNFPDIDVCASVNMWIGTVQAMQYLGDDFDSFYLQREWNRDFTKIGKMSEWCIAHGKQLKMLANSGCLYTCPFHIFHDNLVAHEKEACKYDNALSKMPSPCWDMMHSMNKLDAAATFLQESWVRPEDISKYEPYFSEVKLATRMHSNPRRVVSAYARGRFRGNVFDLTEPSFSSRFHDDILDATLFPDDWFEKTTNCGKDCDRCGYCLQTAKQALVSKASLEKMFFSKI